MVVIIISQPCHVTLAGNKHVDKLKNKSDSSVNKQPVTIIQSTMIALTVVKMKNHTIKR